MNRRSLFLIIILVAVSVVSIAVFPFAGPLDIQIDSIFSDNMMSRVFWYLRFPRVAGAFLAGAVLAVAGMMFQSLFRNDLATPYTLGVSSGAALGAVLAIKIYSGLVPSLPVVEIMSFAGAVATVALIFALSALKKRNSAQFLILAGIAVNFTASGFILFIQFLASGSESSGMVRWMMGNLDFTGIMPVIKLATAFFVIVPVSFYLHRELDLMKVGTDIAISRGVNIRKTTNMIFFTVSFSVAVVVSQTGPIGFIGLIAPHIGRKLVNREHRYLIPASFLIGGLLLLISDTIARTIIVPSEIPVGVITALAGGPFFLFMLLREGKE